MPIQLITNGEAVTLRALFLDSSGVVADPTGGTLVITLPDGTTVTRLITTQTTHDGTGRWHYDYTTTLNGIHTYVWSPTGPVSAPQAGEFLVGDFTRPGPWTEWAGVEDVFDCAPCASVVSPNYGNAALALDAATRILYELTGERYSGIRQFTVRPCLTSDRWGYTASVRASWGSCGCGSSSISECACPSGPVVALPDWPVLQIDSVRVDGSVVASTGYRLDEQRYLRRIDGDTWPSCQDLTANPASESGTFQIVYWAGVQPPPDGIIAVKRLACEIYQACSGGECKLPAKIRDLSRLGMDVAFIEPQDLLANGWTGITEIDYFLMAEKYGRERGTITIASPDHLPSDLRVY